MVILKTERERENLVCEKGHKSEMEVGSHGYVRLFADKVECSLNS